jgi:leucyl aminopeptidase
MLFNLKIFAKENNFAKKQNSLLIKFFTNENNLKQDYINYLKENSILPNNSMLKSFLDKEKNEIEFFNHTGKPDFFFLKKVFPNNKFNVDIFRETLSKIIISLHEKEIENVQIEIPEYEIFNDFFDDEIYYYQTFHEGILLGNYSFDKYKTNKKKIKTLNVNLNGKNLPFVNKAKASSEKLMHGVFLARDLSNEPAITLTPLELVKRIKKLLPKAGITVTALNKTEMKKRKMNSLLAVAEGSENSPYLIKMHYKPKTKAKKKIALVGKGVTYDSGGYSLKPTDAMLEMKGDMSGAATVVGIIYSAALNNLPVEIIGIVPAVENMISGNAYKPGDVISTASGKTIEVKNTDAEGRLILADALEFACKEKPTEIIDFATLTGAIVISLGEFIAGIFTKNNSIAEKLSNSGDKTFELVWRMPFMDEFKKQLDSDIADISNLGPRWGGAITAAKFLEQFVDDKIPYAHVDLAGPSLKHKFRSYTEKYNTGFGVRLMFDYLKNL